MTKFSKAAISNIASVLLYHAEDDFGVVEVESLVVEQVELAAHLKRCLMEGKKRIIIDIDRAK